MLGNNSDKKSALIKEDGYFDPFDNAKARIEKFTNRSALLLFAITVIVFHRVQGENFLLVIYFSLLLSGLVALIIIEIFKGKILKKFDLTRKQYSHLKIEKAFHDWAKRKSEYKTNKALQVDKKSTTQCSNSRSTQEIKTNSTTSNIEIPVIYPIESNDSGSQNLFSKEPLEIQKKIEPVSKIENIETLSNSKTITDNKLKAQKDLSKSQEISSENIIHEPRKKNENKLKNYSRKINNSIKSIPKKLNIFSKTNFLELNKLKHDVGYIGERVVLNYEIQKLKKSGVENIDQRIQHVSKVNDSLGYDILLFLENGEKKYIEVKSTTKNFNEPFYLTEFEFNRMKQLKNYYIYRVFNLDLSKMEGEIYIINCAKHIEKYKIEPVNYRVSP